MPMLVALGRGGRAALRWSMLGQQQAREFAISAEAVSLPDADCDRGAWPAHSRVLPLPKLSHTMEQGRLMKWLVKPGEKVNTCDVVCEVSTEGLAKEEFREGDFVGTVNCLVEAQEEGWMASHLQKADPQGPQLKVGVPIAVLCDKKEDIPKAAELKPTGNVYDKDYHTPVLTWQAHLKAKNGEVKFMG